MKEMKEIPLSTLRVDFLDGIRGWAAVMVVLFHTMVRILANTTPSYQRFYLEFITDGHLAVFIFFVLSGFALSITFIKRPQKISVPLAVITRYFRLFIPILLTSFIVYCLMKAHLMFNIQIADLEDSKHWLGTFYDFEASLIGLLKFCFFDVFFHYERTSSYNIVLWTMQIEYAGSLLIYLSIGLFRHENRKIYLFPLVAIVLYLLRNDTALACFIFGYFLAEVYFSYGHIIKKLKFINIISTLLFIVPIIISTFYRPKDDKYIVLLAFIVVLSITFSPLLKDFFSNALSKFLGRISFPLYLIHMIVISSWSSYLFLHLPLYGYEHQVIANITLATTIVLSIFLAWVFCPMEAFSVKASKYLAKKILSVFFNALHKYHFFFQEKITEFVK
ncbi:MAG: acyltransferase [Methylococcaceae bacterium]|nr:acyltransferase [Methylococcaceae bacterium]